MTKKVLSLLGLCCLFFLSSCMTYTYQDAKKIIPEEPQAAATEIIIPSTPTPEPEEKQDLRPIEVVLIPLPCNAEKTLLDTIIREADEGGYDLIGFTGETEALVYVASLVKTPVYWTQQGKVITSPLSITQTSGEFPLVTLENGQEFRVTLVDIQETTVFQALRAESDQSRWESIIAKEHPSREQAIQPILAYEAETPLLVLASLGEPSAADWFETAADHPYRIPVSWPIVENLLVHRFLDSWRMTHYQAASAPGITWELGTETMTYTERVDFLFSKGLIPIRTTTIDIGEGQKERLPYEQRSALTGTFIIP